MERPTSAGFSLLELLIALAIVAILAAITVPSYSGFFAKARRSDGVVALLQVQLAQERWRSLHTEYVSELSKLGWKTAVSPDRYYELRITYADDTDFIAVAKPVGPQRDDVACGELAISRNGPLYEGYADPACWSR